jgi:hypothetical protein
MFKKLKRPWTWRISEGITPCPWAGKITDDMHLNGLSVDGTHEYLKSIEHEKNVEVFYHPNIYLTERCNLMLKDIVAESLVWQIDCDEFYTPEQIELVANAFEQHEYTSGWFLCRFFVGPDRCLSIGPPVCAWSQRRNMAGNNSSYEWRRVWRWKLGCQFTKHDPPEVVKIDNPANGSIDLNTLNPFQSQALIFNHFAYVLEDQVRFKETRYGFNGAIDGWKRLQQVKVFSVDIHNYLPWLGYGQVDLAPEEHRLKNLNHKI